MADKWDRQEADPQRIWKVVRVSSNKSPLKMRESQAKLAQGPLHGYELSACEIELLLRKVARLAGVRGEIVLTHQG